MDRPLSNCGASFAAPADGFTIRPFLTNVTTGSIDLCFQAEIDLPAAVRYGLTSAYGERVELTGEHFQANWGHYGFNEDDDWYDIVERYSYCGRIEGLAPDTVYHYSVEFGAEDTPDGVFMTAPPSDAPFSFVVYGDSRADHLYPLGVPNRFHQQVINMMYQYAFDFFINVGDIVNDGHDIRLWDIALDIVAPLSSLLPHYPIFGNHEDRNEQGVRGDEVFPLLFSNPGDASGSDSELYYSFDYGNAHYTVIDTCNDFETGTEQNDWIRADLEWANNDPDIRWKFLYFHHPPFSSSLVGIGDTRQRVAREYIPGIAEEYGVDIVFAGHQHSYERSYKDGVYYIVTGNGGALPSFFEAPALNPYNQYFEGNADFEHFGFCHLEIDGDYLFLQSVIADGTVIDTLEIGQPAQDDDDDAGDDDAGDDDAADDDAGDDDDDEAGCGC